MKEHVFYDSNRQKLYQILPLDSPLSVNIEISSICNIGCKYCRHSLGPEEVKTHQSLRNMTPDIFTKIIEQFQSFPHQLKKLVINGVGEPLCNPHFPELLSIAKKLGVAEKIEFFTNATLLTPELSRAIIEAGADRIKISLQGLNSEKYREVCGKSIEYSSFYENIKYLASIRQKTELFIKIIDIGIEHNYQDFLEQYSFADCLSMEYVRPWFPDVDYQNIPQVQQQRIWNKYGRQTSIPCICPIPFYRLYINVDGDVFFCYSIRQPIQPSNCLKQPLLDIWNSDKRKNFLQLMLKKQRNENPVCNDCTMMCDAAFSAEDNLDSYADSILQRF